MTSDITTVLDLVGVRWASSSTTAERIISNRPGITAVNVNPLAQTATVTYDPAVTTVADLAQWITDCGYHCAGRSVPNHVCDPMLEPVATAVVAPEHRHNHTPTPTAAPGHTSDGMRGHDHTAHGPPSQAAPAMPARAAHAGHGSGEHTPGTATSATPQDVMGHGGHHAGMTMADMVRDMRNRFLVAAILSVPILLWSPIGREVLHFTAPAPFGLTDQGWSLLLSLPVIFYSAWIFFDGAYRALRARTLDMMVLVAVAVGAGWIYSVAVTLTGGGDVFFEAATVLTTFVLLGHWFEMRARGGANDAIRTLLELAPPTAVVLRDGSPAEVPTAQVAVGDLLLIRPGARVPVDGTVEDGTSEVDESMVTGESVPVPKSVGSDVIGASVNTTGVLRVRATKVGADTALAQIVALVQQAQNSKAPGQRLADRAAFWLVLVALVGGAVTFAAWLAVGRPVQEALLFAITVVVVTCPDALGLATPTAIMVGSGLGAKRGILFKDATALETSAHIDTVVLDKTGTITRGTPVVTDVHVEGADSGTVLAWAASIEAESEHPLARAILEHATNQGVNRSPVQGFRNVPGHGATGTVDGHPVTVGSRRLMTDQHVTVPEGLATAQQRLANQGRTAVFVAGDAVAVAVIGVSDEPRPSAAQAVQALHDRQIHVIMLTGDNEATAKRIADEVGIDTLIADVLPERKAAEITALQQQGRKVAMVGDGVNDAPALAQADLGIAIGAGTDVAIETADVVLMRSDPVDVAVAVQIGAGTVRKMRQNLAWAIGYNAIALPIAAGVFEPTFGLVLRPEIAALTMSGSSILVAVNALMLRRLHLPTQTTEPTNETVRSQQGQTTTQHHSDGG